MSSNIRAEKKQSPSSSPITSLPEDVVLDILARVPRRDYPRVSLVSKYFRSLVSSPEIYARRSSLGCTEHCLYVVLYEKDNDDNMYKRLYMLRQKEKDKGFRPKKKRKRKKDKGLVLIPGLPAMPRYESVAAVGSRIYVFDGINSYIIDCTSHTVQHLPRMPVPLSYTVAGVIGGRVYVFGYRGKSKAMLVFNTETQTWEDGMTKPVRKVCDGSLVVMADKMYMTDGMKSFVYDPKESKWETDKMLSSKFWEYACVVDDVLYYHHFSDNELIAYDPEHKCWQVVKGVKKVLAKMRRVGYFWAKTVSYAGKLVLFFRKKGVTGEICFAKISVERREGGQIWGKVDQWCDHGLIAGGFYFTKSLDVVL
ncbi:unnamed protein product [Brassica rapa subsp. trilocularis]